MLSRCHGGNMLASHDGDDALKFQRLYNSIVEYHATDGNDDGCGGDNYNDNYNDDDDNDDVIDEAFERSLRKGILFQLRERALSLF